MVSNFNDTGDATQLALMDLPPIDRATQPLRNHSTFQKGFIAEELTNLELQLLGHHSVLGPAGAPYDVICEVGSGVLAGRLLKIQVKSRTKLETKMKFEMCRHSARHGPRNFAYEPGSFDCSALVSIPDRSVLFFPGIQRRYYIYREQFLRENATLISLNHTLEAIANLSGGHHV